MKFEQVLLIAVLICCTFNNCSAKRREKRTLGTILQFFGYKIVPLNQNQEVRETQALRMRPNRIETVMPTERIETTPFTPEAASENIVMEQVPSLSTSEPIQPQVDVTSSSPIVPSFIPMRENVPLRIIIDDMNMQSTPMTAAPVTPPAVPTPTEFTQSVTPVEEMKTPTAAQDTLPTTPLTTTTAPILEQPSVVTSLNGAPLPQLMPAMPFRIMMNDMTAPESNSYVGNIPTSTEAVAIDVRTSQISNEPVNQSIKPSENIQALPLSYNIDQQFAADSVQAKQRVQEKSNNNVEVLRSNEVSSSFFGQQTFPPGFNVFPQFLMPPTSFEAPQEEIDRRDFSTSRAAMNFNGQYFNYLTFHR